MKTVILCGGMGTRIRDVNENIPKPMLLIGNRPILWHIMKIYSYFGFKDFVLCLGYKGNVIKDFFLNYYSMMNDVTIDLSRPNSMKYHKVREWEDWQVTLADTGIDSMTGARVFNIKKYLGDDSHFLLTYGDGVADVDIHALLAFHQSHGKLVTVTGVHPAGRFGEMDIACDRRVNAFAEKPQVSEGRINGGFFVMQREFIDRYLGEDPALILEHSPLAQCAKDGELMAFMHDGYWQPMDTYREFRMLNNLWDKGKAPWKIWK